VTSCSSRASATRTVHLVYPSGPGIAAPEAIGRNLAAHLQGRYVVRQYDWDEIRLIRPGADDVLVGHPHPAPWTVFRMSSTLRGWRRVIALCPYAHGAPEFIAFLDQVIERCDLYLAITGDHWFQTIADSAFAHWRPKMVHVDLAVDRDDFPRVKGRFNPAGERRFVYIGSTGVPKNTGYLTEIARRMPESAFSWIGRGKGQLAGVRELGFQDFRTAAARELVAKHDFLVTVGSSDANPTTILEAMAWGLIPVCTPQSGYDARAGIVNVPLGNADAAVSVLRRLQGAPEGELDALRAANDAELQKHFTWDRLTQQVVDAIESTASPPLGERVGTSRSGALLTALVSPISPLRPANVAWLAKRNGSRILGRTK
jgi:glycosyltransferase involved in cell wall biosynthesis